jgi:hypothetical protein
VKTSKCEQANQGRFPLHRPLWLFGLFACLAIAGCGKSSTLPAGQSDQKGSADSANAKKGGTETPKKAADFSLTSEELETEYHKDEKAADKKYEGKTIELSGVIADIYGDDDAAYVGLIAGKRILGLPCVMIDKEPWAQLAVGQTVKLRGQWAISQKPALFKCEIVEAGPNPALVLSATQLADEYTKDPKGVKEKYAGRPVILSGEVVENKNDDKEGRYVRLKTPDKVTVKLTFGALLAARGAKITSGQTIKAYGVFKDFNLSDGNITLTNPYLITK